MKPLISIIIPTYNRSHYLVGAINSVLTQTYKHFEIIIVDDASTDNTEEIVRGISDTSVMYMKQAQRQGAPAARNNGLREAKGEFVAFLDSDDEWLPTKLEKQMDLFLRSPDNVGLIYTGLLWVDSDNQPIQEVRPLKRGDIFQNLLIWNCIGTMSSPLIRKSFLVIINGFDESFPSCQDWDLYIRLSQLCQIDYVDELLVNYKLDQSSLKISNNRDQVSKGLQMISKKYGSELNAQPSKVKAAHFLWVAKVIMLRGQVSDAVKNFFRSVLNSRNIFFVFRATREFVTCFVERRRWIKEKYL